MIHQVLLLLHHVLAQHSPLISSSSLPTLFFWEEAEAREIDRDGSPTCSLRRPFQFVSWTSQPWMDLLATWRSRTGLKPVHKFCFLLYRFKILIPRGENRAPVSFIFDTHWFGTLRHPILCIETEAFSLHPIPNSNSSLTPFLLQHLQQSLHLQQVSSPHIIMKQHAPTAHLPSQHMLPAMPRLLHIYAVNKTCTGSIKTRKQALLARIVRFSRYSSSI